MNKLEAELPDFVGRLEAGLGDRKHDLGERFDVVLCPAMVHLGALARSLEGRALGLGAQNCGTTRFGAFTGEVSPVMLKELGVRWVLVGHSERRHVFNETDELVATRAKAALEEGLDVIYCVGELLEERKRGETFDVLRRQLAKLEDAVAPAAWEAVTIAYEPVWAIGTGETATPQQAQEAHRFIRGWMDGKVPSPAAIRILYGGSVKPENSASLMAQADVDGLLVGTASLDAAVFAGVVKNGLSES